MNTVSVVILTYNRADALEQALRSVLAQTYPPKEILVVDNASTDGTKVRVMRYMEADGRIRYLTFSRRGEICAARNCGAAAAQGTFLAFLDDDDQWEPTHLERQVAMFDRHPEVVLVYTWAKMVDADGRFLGIMPSQPSGNTYRELCTKDFICGVSVAMVRADAFRRVGGFRPSFEGAEDHDLWIRLSRRGRIASVEEPLTIHRRQAGSFSHNRLRSALAHSRALLDAPASASEGVTRHWLRQRAAVLRYHAASYRLHDQRFLQAAATFVEALWIDPLVGLSVKWSSHAAAGYRLVKPVMAAGYCLVRGCLPRRVESLLP